MKTPKKLINTISQYKNGNEDVFVSIYELSYKKLYTCMLYIVQNKDVANNILQDTYDELKKTISDIKTPWEFLNIASITGSKLCYEYLKKENKDELSGNADDTSITKIEDNERFLQDKFLQDKEKINEIHGIIDGLNAMQRLCVVATYFNEQKPDDISKMLDISAEKVQSELNVFKGRLKELAGKTSENKGAKLYGVSQFMHQFFTKDVENFTSELVIPAISTRIEIAAKEPEKEKPEPSTVREELKEKDKISEEKNAEDKSEEKSDEKPAKSSSNIKLNIIVAVCAACIGFIAGAFYMNWKISAVKGIAAGSTTEDAATAEEQSNKAEEQGAEPEPEETVYLTEITGLDKYDDYGRAYGGIIPVAKDGKFGAVNYLGEVVVPCEYESCYSSADDSGSIILADGDVKKVFDKNGKLVYEGADDVRVSGGMYITLEYNDAEYSANTVFHKMDGTEVLSFPCEYGISHINVFYDDICTVQKKADDESENEDETVAMIGTVTADGKVSWKPDETYLLNSIISTENHGYYVSHDPIVAPTILNMYDTKGELVSTIDFGYLVPDDKKGFEISDTINEDNMYYGFWANGGYFYNYGSKMLFGIGDKKVLVDFAKSPGMQLDTMTNDIVTAVYDEILLADEKYWLVSRGGKWGYIDHDGKEMHMYDDASAFSHGKAFVVENGNAYLIDENFEKIQDMGSADRVSLRGELLYIEQNGKPHVYEVAE